MEADALKMMKRKRRNLLLVLTAGLMAALTAGVLCACAQPDREQQIIEQGYVCEVTYDANGGSFDTAVSASRIFPDRATTEICPLARLGALRSPRPCAPTTT